MVLIEILIILLLLVLNGLFAMSELAIVSSRRARLQEIASRGSRGATTALKLIADPSRFLASVQIGITLIGILAGASSGARLADRLGVVLNRIDWIAPNGPGVAVAVVVLLITFASVIIGELVPKRIALNDPERIASLVARPMQFLARLASPVVWLLKATTEALLALLRLNQSRNEVVSEDEVRSLIAEGTRAGIFAPQEREMIDGVLRIADRNVRAIMSPRREIIWIDRQETRENLRERLSSLRYSQYPVCDGSIDAVVGVIHTRDLWKAHLEDGRLDLDQIMQQPLAIHDNLPVLRLLDLFRSSGVQIAIVVDEFGTTEGLVTLTDVLEAIAGEFPGMDEPDEERLKMREDGSWLVDGTYPVDEFEHRTGARDLKKGGDFTTMAGLVLHRFGHMPKVGESQPFEDVTLEVLDMDGRRIDRILVTLPRKESGGDAAGI